jgi:hypothetical protein
VSILVENPQAICQNLKNLIDSEDKQDELECRKYLGCAEEFLFKKDTLEQRLYSEREVPTNMGETDYVISGKVGNDPYLDPECVRTYIWEFKAPQCYIFKKDGENRLSPTKELFQAENQLLNYYHSLKFNQNMIDRFRAGHPNNIRIGGIIIGSCDRLVRGKLESEKKKALLKDAFNIRKAYFYKETDLWLFTWSDVLDYLNKKFINLTKESTSPEFAFPDTRINAGTISAQETIQNP